MSRSINFMLASALVSTGACTNDSAEQADRAAHDLVERDQQLHAAQTRVDEGGSPDHARIADHEVAVVHAADAFALRRSARVQGLAAEHGVIATQAGLVQSLSDALPLTDIGRSELTEKLTVFRLRLADSAHAIEALQAVPATQFAERDDAVSKAMTRLEDARTSTWKALAEAPRLDRSASL